MVERAATNPFCYAVAKFALLAVLFGASFDTTRLGGRGCAAAGPPVSPGAEPAATHPHLPGVIGRGVNDPNWTRTLHDALPTGHSPLTSRMQAAPTVRSALPLTGALTALHLLENDDSPPMLLLDDGQLTLLDLENAPRWSHASLGTLVASGDLRGTGGHHALFTAGAQLALLDLESGELLWRHTFLPIHVSLSVQVHDLLPERPGQEAAVFLTHGTRGLVINLAPADGPEIIWDENVGDPDFDPRYDHHNGTIALDLSDAEHPVVWNLRRHRCRGYDARTGRRLSTITYDIGGAQRRNYGPLHLGRGRDEQPLACVFGERVQVHVHAIRLHRDRDNELAWHHYYGEVYKQAPGVALVSHGLVDLEGDGLDEMIYSVRDPERDFRSIVRIRAADSGQVGYELVDHWGVAAFENVGPDRASGFLAIEAPDGAMPQRGRLKVILFRPEGEPTEIATRPLAGPWGPLVVDGHRGNELLLFEQDSQQTKSLARYEIVDNGLREVSRTTASLLLEKPLLAAAYDPAEQTMVYLCQSETALHAARFNGEPLWQRSLQGGLSASVSAADLDSDGRAEIAAAISDGTMRIYGLGDDDNLVELRRMEHLLGWHNHHPVLCDLSGDGQLCVLTAGDNAAGDLVIRAYRPDGEQLWETRLPATVANLRGVILNAGPFLEGGRIAVAVSLIDDRQVHEGTYLLDGPTGQQHWFRDLYRSGGIVMPCRPNGIPTAYDYDQDGVEEIGMDMLSYMAFLNGDDGNFALVLPTQNITSDDAVYAGHLYNTYCPLWQTPSDAKPHWFVTAGFGSFGLMKPDPREGIWKVVLDYDSPPNVALVDVDGDGQLEAGYAAINDATFVCRDVWTGEVEWELELPTAPNAATITADLDGDGRGDFFCGRYAIGVDAEGQATLKWEAPVHFSWPIIADVDGDQEGEIVGGSGLGIVVLDK